MKHAVAAPDPSGFNFTEPDEPLRFTGHVCHSRNCGCDISFAGVRSHKAATLALVVERDVDVALSVRVDQRWLALQRALARIPAGRFIRVKYLWRKGEVGGAADLARWSITVVSVPS